MSKAAAPVLDEAALDYALMRANEGFPVHAHIRKSAAREIVEWYEILKSHSAWMPIESCPKDGRLLLLCVNGQTQPMSWNKDVSNWQEWPDGDFMIDGVDKATHWMPLPKPPRTSSENQFACPSCGMPNWVRDIAEKAAGDALHSMLCNNGKQE